MSKTVFVLASASPRRKEILENIGIKAETIASNADESVITGLSPEKTVMELSVLKASSVASELRGNVIVIGADTCVCLDGKIMGKPKHEEDAFNMLSSLSGRTHDVYTGYCVIDVKTGKTEARYEHTYVTFKSLCEKEIRSYIATREPMDKAGGYGIQKKGALFVKKIEGDYFNVVGLPVCGLAELLKDEFSIVL